MTDASKNIEPAINFLEAQNRSGAIIISIVSAMELVQGCRSESELRVVTNLFHALTVLPITPTLSQRALQLMQTYWLSHGLTMPDALIAATALEHRLPLYTRNIRHFRMISELQAIAPY